LPLTAAKPESLDEHKNGSQMAAVFLCDFGVDGGVVSSAHPIKYGSLFAIRQGKNHFFLSFLTKRIH
jgi:hypothetical protein